MYLYIPIDIDRQAHGLVAPILPKTLSHRHGPMCSKLAKPTEPTDGIWKMVKEYCFWCPPMEPFIEINSRVLGRRHGNQ